MIKKMKLFIFLYYFIFVAIGFFFSPYLISKGLNIINIGYCTSLGLLLMIILYFLYGFLADYIGSSKPLVCLNLIISIIIFFILIFSTNDTLLYISYTLSYGTFMVLTPIVDGIIVNNFNTNKYSSIRSFGSLGAAISYFFNTFFLSDSTNSYVFIILLNIIFLFILISLLFTIKENYQIKERNFTKSFKSIAKNKKIILILIIAFLTYGTLKADDPYSYKYNIDVVLATPFFVAIAGSLAIFFESYIMRLYEKVSDYKKSNLLVIASTTLFIIYLSRTFLYNNVVIILITNILIGLFIGLFVPIAILTITKNSPKELRNTILSTYQIAISFGGVLIGGITTFYLSKTQFLPKIYLLHSTIILIAILIIFIFKKEIDN